MSEQTDGTSRKGLNPLNYSLKEVQKALIALIGFLGFAAFYLVNTGWDPALVPALEALVPAAIAVGVVFAATNHTPADLQKALLGLISAGVGVWNALGQGQVDPSTEQTLVVAAGYIATFIGVYWKGNRPLSTE